MCVPRCTCTRRATSSSKAQSRSRPRSHSHPQRALVQLLRARCPTNQSPHHHCHHTSLVAAAATAAAEPTLHLHLLHHHHQTTATWHTPPHPTSAHQITSQHNTPQSPRKPSRSRRDTLAFAQIKEIETGYHRFLDESYGSVAETSFKALRRKMPLTQQKFQWSKIATYSLAKELTNK